jgi:hypothetical protein
MEPRKIETPIETRGEAQTSPSRQPEGKRRFQIVKLEERIAPCNRPTSKGHNCCFTFIAGGGVVRDRRAGLQEWQWPWRGKEDAPRFNAG